MVFNDNVNKLKHFNNSAKLINKSAQILTKVILLSLSYINQNYQIGL